MTQLHSLQRYELIWGWLERRAVLGGGGTVDYSHLSHLFSSLLSFCLLFFHFFFWPSWFHFCFLSSLLHLSPCGTPPSPVAMAPVVTGATIHGRQWQQWLRTPAPWRTTGEPQRPGGAGRRITWRLSPSGLGRRYGWSARGRGTLGTGTSHSSAKPETIQVQRQQQTRSLPRRGRVSNCLLFLSTLPRPITEHFYISAFHLWKFLFFFFVTSLTALRLLHLPGLCNSFWPGSLPTLEPRAHLRSHGKVTPR